MARDIPQDQPLTDDDRHYLQQRGSWGEAIIARVDENFPATEPVALEDDDTEPVDYSGWTKSELQTEVDRRNAEGGPQLDRNGTKAELANRLAEADAAAAEDEESDTDEE